MSTTERDLKIRTSYSLDSQFLRARLIHKIKVGSDQYIIRAIDFSDPALIDIMNRYIFAEYDQRIIEAITTLYHYESDKMKTIIKRYSGTLRTISVEGEQADIEAWRAKAEKHLGRKLAVVIPDDRSFGAHVSETFVFSEHKELERLAFVLYTQDKG